MKKIYGLLTVLFLIGIMSCEDDNDPAKFDPEVDITEDRGVAPGDKYTTEAGTKYVDVFYFIPAGTSPVDDWHWRLSGIVRHVQDYFAENMSKYYQIEKKFELVKNEANPKYIDIRMVQGKHPADFYADSIGTIALANELKEYCDSQTEVKTGHHHIVFAPENMRRITNLRHENAEEMPDEFFIFWGCDRTDLSMKYFPYDLYRQRYLKNLGMMLYTAGASFGLMNNDAKAAEPYRSLMSSGLYTYASDPDAVRITGADALILNECEAFNPTSDEVRYDVLPDPDQIMIRSVNIDAQTTRFVVTCMFTTNQPVASLFVFHDPWRAVNEEGEPDEQQDIDTLDEGTTFDAILFGTSDLQETALPNGTYMYSATISMPVSAIKETYKKALKGNEYAKAEFRFRILFKNGFKYPDDAKCGAYFDDVKIRTDRFRYQYYWVEDKPLIPFRNVTAKDKGTWTSEMVYPEAEKEVPELLDGDVNTVWEVPFDVESTDKPEVDISFNNYISINGIMIHRGQQENRASRVTITVWAWDWDANTLMPEEICSKALLVGSEDMYYYFDYKKDYVWYVSVKLEASDGKDSVSLAEIGAY